MKSSLLLLLLAQRYRRPAPLLASTVAALSSSQPRPSAAPTAEPRVCGCRPVSYRALHTNPHPSSKMSTPSQPNGGAAAAAAAATPASAAAAAAAAAPLTGPNNWTHPGPAEFDLRSDVVTTPTPAMLAAVAQASLLDDVFAEDPTTNALQSRIADLTGKEAALLVPSGTMGNQLALRALLPTPPASLLADARAHILAWEAGGAAWISGALAQPVTPANGHHLTAADVRAAAVTSDDVHACPTGVIALENTLGGTILPLADAQAISAWARAQTPPIATHMDGARLWDAVAAGAGSLRAYCGAVDTVTLCFSKGLGAPAGSMLAGPAAVIARARHLRKAMGGGLRQAGLLAGPAGTAVERTFEGGLLAGSHARARQVAAAWTARGGRLALPVETSMVWADLGAAGVSEAEFVRVMGEEGLRALGGRLVVHYQVSEDAVRRFETVAERILVGGEGKGVGVHGDLAAKRTDVEAE